MSKSLSPRSSAILFLLRALPLLLVVVLACFHGLLQVAAAPAAGQGGDDDDSECDTPTAYMRYGPIIAVTSCTGFVGSRVVRSLRHVGISSGDIRCLVHRDTAKSTDSLMDLEDVREVDFLDQESIAEALRGTVAVYVNTPPSVDVLKMRSNIAGAIHQAGGINHVVALGEPADVSWYGLSKYWDDHRTGLSELERLGIPLTILQPAWFLDMFPAIVAHDIFQRVGTKPSPYSSVTDVADVTAKILREGPIVHGWKRYNLINSVLTGKEIAQAMTEARGGVDTTYVPISLDDFWHGMVDHDHVTESQAEGFTKAMALNDAGVYSTDDLGQLRMLLGRRPLEAVEVFTGMRHYFNRADRQQSKKKKATTTKKSQDKNQLGEAKAPDGDKNASSLGYNEQESGSMEKLKEEVAIRAVAPEKEGSESE